MAVGANNNPVAIRHLQVLSQAPPRAEKGEEMKGECNPDAKCETILVCHRTCDVQIERDRHKAALLIIPVDRLRHLARWFDQYDDARNFAGERIVQADLRKLADAIDALKIVPRPPEKGGE
jgi:hypothetical protein